jgi:hypothetical protein
MFKVLPAVASALFLSACGGGLSQQMEDGKDPKASMIYGYIDMANGPCWMEWFRLKQVLPKSEEPYVSFRVDDGAFYAEYIPPGSYQLHEFGGAGSWPNNAFYAFRFPAQMEGIRVDEPSLIYVGAFKMKNIGNFFGAKYDVDFVKTPTEREVLTKILPHAKGTVWEQRLRRRLEQLQ